MIYRTNADKNVSNANIRTEYLDISFLGEIAQKKLTATAVHYPSLDVYVKVTVLPTMIILAFICFAISLRSYRRIWTLAYFRARLAQ